MLNLKPTIEFLDLHSTDNHLWPVTNSEVVMAAMSMLQQHCHAASYNRGWWHDPITGLSLLPHGTDEADEPLHQFRRSVFPLVVAAKIALIHSEVSEMLEAHRTGAWDDKIPFPGMTAEGGDIMIRLFDLFGMLQWAAQQGIIEHHDVKGGYSLGAALLTKLPYNVGRVDHALEKRAQPGQKKY